MLEWLGRRWLYNIPRSQLTEGLRPLGRLALVDHSEVIWNACRASLNKLAGPTLAGQRSTATAARGGDCRLGWRHGWRHGPGSRRRPPAIARRTQIERQNSSDISVFSTPHHARNAAGSQLAMANTCALLAEWQHLLHPGAQFPGDRLVPARRGTIDQSPRTRIIDMGEDLSNEDFDAACGRLADLIALDIKYKTWQSPNVSWNNSD